MGKQSNTSGKSKAKRPTSKETYKVVVETTPTDDNTNTEGNTTEDEDSPVLATVDKQANPTEQDKSSRAKSVLPKSSNKQATKKPKSRQASLAKDGKQPMTGGKSKTRRRPPKETYKMVVETTPTDDDTNTEGDTTEDEDSPVVATIDKPINATEQEKSSSAKSVLPKSSNKLATKKPKSRQASLAKGGKQPMTGGKSKTKRRPSTYKMVETLLTDDSASTGIKTTKEEEAMVPMVATVKQANSSDQSKSACVKSVRPKSSSKQTGKRPKSKERPKSKGKQRPKSKEHFVAEAKPKTKPHTLSAHKSSSKKSVLSKTANAKSTTTKTATKENNPTNVFILANPNDAQAMELIKQLLLKVNAPQEDPAVDMPPVEWVTEKAHLEELYDAAYELHNKIKTVQESYQEIVRSLVNMQNRRPKGNSGLLSQSNTKTSGVAKSKATGVIASKETPVPRILESFMNPTTRDTAFRELFANVDTLKTAMAPFESCFDAAGYIDMNKYESNRVSTTNRDAWMADIRSLDQLVGAILAEYNKEVLDMFRLSQSKM